MTRALDDAARGRGGTVFVSGEGGVGKTRLMHVLAEEAARRGFTVAVGRGYPVETGVPYALFSDAFVPTLRSLDASTLAVLSRGGEGELAQLFPALGRGERAGHGVRGDPAELKARLLWNFAQFLARFAAKKPLVIVLENLQWADASSLELLHFTARQIAGERILLVCSYNIAERDSNPTLAATERSLVSLGVATELRLEPLERPEVDELLRSVFSVETSALRNFTTLLYERTRGNPFFVDEMLKSLVDSGQLRQVDGRWSGWDIADLELPHTIREAVIARLGRLSASARAIADLAAVMVARVRHDVLQTVTRLSAEDLIAALDELRRERVLVEGAGPDPLCYDFTHPILQSTLYAELGRARARLLHGTVASTLERLYGESADTRADELAFHFSKADAGASASKAARYLAAAGRLALDRNATREAATYLSEALTRYESLEETERDQAAVRSVVEDLARAKQRSGEYDAANALWLRARADAAARGELGRLASIERRIGLAHYWSGRHEEALDHYASGLEAATRAGDAPLGARLRIARAMCLQELGRSSEARAEVEVAVSAAEGARDDATLARTHRTLLLLYGWTGPADVAREHGEKAIAHASASGERGVEWSAHWAIAALAGLTGDAATLARHVAEAERLADELRSPVLGAWTAEVSIEYASAVGDWDTGLALAERTMPVARVVGRRTLLPRLLVWTGLMHLGRGEVDRAKQFFDESWQLSGASGDRQSGVDVHTVVPAHTGMAAYHLALGEYSRAIEIGEAGVAIADRTGFVVWAIHRLLPIVIEASLWVQDFERAARYGGRLRRDSEALGHKLGLAWAMACDALVARLRDKDTRRAIGLLRSAADALEAVPFAVDASRIRRNLAQLLAAEGDREGAMRELRHAHDVFARVGAERELTGTRDQLRDLGARPPSRVVAEGAGALTGREREIAQLVAARKSNKEIGSALGISARTVSTHLSNIFGKLGVGSRGELTDRVRSDPELRGE